MQRISHLFYYTTPAVGKSRTAATGRSGWAEAADRFARAALCLRLLYHKTLSTGTKTRGKYGSCLKKHPEFRKRFRAFSGKPLLSEQSLFRESSRSGKTLRFRTGFGRFRIGSGKVLRLREKLLFRENRGQEETPLGVSFRHKQKRNFRFRGNLPEPGRPGRPVPPPNAAGEKRTLLQAIRARARNPGESRTKSFEILRKVNFVPLSGRILANPHERWIFEESFGEFPGCCSGNPVSNQCFT